MPIITLKDGTQKTFATPVSVEALALSIGAGLAKATIAGFVNDRLVDTSFEIHEDAVVSLVTAKDEAGLEVIRHSCAHLLAQAVKRLFPSAQVTIGPVIEAGFFYDLDIEHSLTPEDLERIEAKMHELAKEEQVITRKEMSAEEGIALFKSLGEHYKVEIIEELKQAGESLSFYQQSEFIDLCRGPHVPHTGFLKAFKLTKLAGAYWRGDSKNKMLQRVYGTAWGDQKQLNAYLMMLEEAKKRDHRELGKKMDLFHLQDLSPGMVFWHPNGWALINALRDYIRGVQRIHHYQEINTPMFADERLWEMSGHKEKFREGMFFLETDDRQYAVKPMNCPCHIQVYKQGIKSYKDLPIRFAEFGCCHRYEPSGTLHGLMRVRGFVQDDGHIFCTEQQIHTEVMAFIAQLQAVYRDLGFTEVIYKLSTRPEKRVGSEESWDKAEKALSDSLDAAKVDWQVLPGEGAFYGPKIEFSLKDCLGRVWQCGTIQVDFSMPGRLEATYIDEKGEKQVPVMLHRAMLGSFERFSAILLEHYAGWLPIWLAPRQVVVMGVTDRQADQVVKLTQKLQNLGFRAIFDLRNEKIGFKIREHAISRIPYQLVLGDREVEQNTVTVRLRNDNQSVTLSWDALVAQLQEDIQNKR